MSPLIGVTVAAFEAWNIQYATLTDKAAKDFSRSRASPSPGRARTTGSPGPTSCAPNMKWSDGKPLTAEDIAWTVNTSREEEWLNHFAVTANLTATAPDPTDGRDQDARVPDPKLPAMDVYILPKHIWGKMRRGRAREVRGRRTASAPARSCSTSSRRASSPASRPTPTTGAASRPSTRSCCASSTTRTRWSPRSRPASSTRRWDIPGARLQRARERRQHRDERGQPGRDSREIAINGGDGLKKPHPALADPEVRKAIAPRDRQGDARGPGARRARQAARDDQPVRPTRSGCPSSSDGQVYEFDLDRANADPRRGRLQGHRRRRRPRDAGRRASRSTSPTCVALRRRDRPEDRRVRHAAGWTRSASPRREKIVERQPAHADHRQGRLRHVRLGLDARTSTRTRCSTT